ncbi:MAG: hypothetical protein Q7J44_14090 [Pseudotabrizicola sp.]|uniref:hypothetical protein n=1 Tax=Pseudotabrizicola sp. TaxID=2939647 RepID=UPI00271DF6DF|nr:hypothetical protein [Pseudotabrizicola sp.]MDO9639666.1 hypothetical protein [Pseudotabrizicola sp.]
MTQPTYEQLALMQMQEQVATLERLAETLANDLIRQSRRLDRLERKERSRSRGRAGVQKP